MSGDGDTLDRLLFSEALVMDIPTTWHWHGYLLDIPNTTSKVHESQAAARKSEVVH